MKILDTNIIHENFGDTSKEQGSFNDINELKH